MEPPPGFDPQRQRKNFLKKDFGRGQHHHRFKMRKDEECEKGWSPFLGRVHFPEIFRDRRGRGRLRPPFLRRNLFRRNSGRNRARLFGPDV